MYSRPAVPEVVVNVDATLHHEDCSGGRDRGRALHALALAAVLLYVTRATEGGGSAPLMQAAGQGRSGLWAVGKACGQLAGERLKMRAL